MQNVAKSPGVKPTVTNNPVTSGGPAGPSKLALVLRIVRWSVYGLALILLILVLHKSAPPPVVTNREAAARVEQKFADAQQAVAQGQPATLRMDETELNSYLASHLDLGGVGGANAASDGNSGATQGGGEATAEDIEKMRSNVRDVKVQLIEDRVKAYVVFDVHGKDMTLQLEGKLGADNGFLRFEPVSGQLGALPIPQSTLEAAVKRMMESPENREKLKLPADISDLRIENGEVVAQYQ
jgi:hypothetical protein